MSKKNEFIPALGYDRLTALYDKVIQWTMPEERFRTKLVQHLSPQAKERIMEFGFGTAQNLIYAIQVENKVDYFGLDIDLKVKSIAKEKLQKIQFLRNVELDLYDGITFPYPNNFFDKVFSCLVFHQLESQAKKAVLNEIYRVLKPNSLVLICDWGKPSNLYTNLGFLAVQLLDGFKTTNDNKKGLLPLFLEEAGFTDVKEIDFEDTKIGTLRYLSGVKKNKDEILLSN